VVDVVAGERRFLAKLRQQAEEAYSPTYAAGYRDSDELGCHSESHAGKCKIIRALSRRFTTPVSMLDLGCGSGRYFHCAANVKSVTGVDTSIAMLHEARRPVAGGHRNVRLVRSTVQEVAFRPQSFDLVICVGVLALWCPLDLSVLRRVASLMTAHGVFFFTAVTHQETPDSVKRRMARAVRPLLFGGARRAVDLRLRDFTVSEGQVREMGRQCFAEVDVTRWTSASGRVDLHCVMAKPRPDES
jgi:ubiquinone/menaquinone biosynthesis C-methylase UbiE